MKNPHMQNLASHKTPFIEMVIHKNCIVMFIKKIIRY